MELKNYWNDVDNRLNQLIEFGEVKLPSIKNFKLNLFANEISQSMGSKTFKELSVDNRSFLDEININTFLISKLFKIAQKHFNYKGDINNQYFVARKVQPGDNKEMYRAHFDSHIFTIILPLKIPNSKVEDNCGELIYFPNIRAHPINELNNLIQKIYYKLYASKTGIEKLRKSKKNKIENFKDYEPLIFCGKRTLHTNYPVSASCLSYRLTLLIHLFDDSPNFSVGNFLRLLRKR